MNVRVTTITVAYNASATIGDTLRSVANQTYTNVEHIVIDGASTDDTVEVIRREGIHVSRLVSEHDQGIYDALNKGIKMATGDVIGFLHADDLFADERVLTDIARQFEDPSVEAVYGDLVYVSAADVSRVIRYWRAGEFSRKGLASGWMPPHPTLYVRRSVYERLGIFDTRYRISADYDSVVRFFGPGGVRPVYLPRLLIRMRVGGISNRSIKTIWRKSCEDLDIMRRHRIGGLSSLLSKNVRKLNQFWQR
ncbi:glycosyltransferase family 2 protein [Roseateles sp.]|uniref:glycosyltransferase family 2 protein n=1 Tax=Roseateles sp. TaxID=1971397 RepID=UPI003BA45108